MLEDTRSENPFLRRDRWIVSKRVAGKLPVSDVPHEIGAGLTDPISLVILLVSLLAETVAAETTSGLANWGLVELLLSAPTESS